MGGGQIGDDIYNSYELIVTFMNFLEISYSSIEEGFPDAVLLLT